MTKAFLYFFVLFFPIIGISQETWQEYTIDANLSDPFFNSSDSIYNPCTLVFTDEAGVVHFDGIPDSNKYEVTANVIIEDSWIDTLKFSTAHWEDSILVIDIYLGTPAGYQGILIRIYGNKYQISYEQNTPIPFERSVKNINSKLILKREISGDENIIYAYVELNSVVTTEVNPDFSNSKTTNSYQMKGFFKVKIIEK